MTKKRYLAVAGLFAILLGAGFGVAMMLPPVPGVTKANFDRVQIGMTSEEVTEILGDKFIIGLRVKEMEERHFIHSWRHNNGARAEVAFYKRVVDDKTWTSPTETIVAKLRRWLRL